MTMEVLCAVIDNRKYMDKGFDYLEENSHKISVDCSCFLDKIKLRIQRLLKQKVVFNNEALPPPLEEEKDTFANHIMNVSHAIESSIKIKEEENVKLLKKRKRINIKNIKDSIGFNISQTMLGSCTRSDFTEIR